MHNPAGIPGLEIPQSRIPGLRKQVRDWNPLDMGLCNTILEHLYPILCDFLRDLEQKNINY